MLWDIILGKFLTVGSSQQPAAMLLFLTVRIKQIFWTKQKLIFLCIFILFSAQLVKISEDERVKEKLRNTSTSINQLMHQLMHSRSEKQTKLLEKVFGNKPRVTIVRKEAVASPDRMSKSEMASSTTAYNQTDNTELELPIQRATLSLDRADPTHVKISTELSNLMHQSQLLDLE